MSRTSSQSDRSLGRGCLLRRDKEIGAIAPVSPSNLLSIVTMFRALTSRYRPIVDIPCQEIPDLWANGGHRYGVEKQLAEELCLECPILDGCRRWAGQFRWRAVTIAGWTASNEVESFPPWITGKVSKTWGRERALTGQLQMKDHDDDRRWPNTPEHRELARWAQQELKKRHWDAAV